MLRSLPTAVEALDNPYEPNAVYIQFLFSFSMTSIIFSFACFLLLFFVSFFFSLPILSVFDVGMRSDIYDMKHMRGSLSWKAVM